MDDSKSEVSGEWMLPARQHRSREQRDRLLKAGEQVFAKRGFADSHISEIVSGAKCSIGSFYRRFKDKEALFLALQEDMYQQSLRKIDRFFSNPACESKPLTVVFFRLLENTANEAMCIKGYYRALFELSLRGREVWDQMRELERYQAEQIEKLLIKRSINKRRAEFVPNVTLVIRMVTGAQISLILHGPDAFRRSAARVHAEYTRVLMTSAGLTPDPAELESLCKEGGRGRASPFRE